MNINRVLLKESWTSVIDDLVDVFKKVKPYDTGVGFRTTSKVMINGVEILEKDFNDLLSKLINRNLDSLTDEEIEIILKTINDTESLSTKIYSDTVREFEQQGGKIDDLVKAINDNKLTEAQIYNDLTTKFGFDPITAKFLSKELKESAEQVKNAGKLLPRLREVANNSSYWSGVIAKCNMSPNEFISYWRYSPFNKAFQNSVQEIFRQGVIKIKGIETATDDFLDDMLGFFQSLVEESKTGRNLMKEYQTDFNKLTTKIDELVSAGGGIYDKNLFVDELIKIFKSNPEFKLLNEEQQKILESTVRESLEKFDPKSQKYPGWFSFIFDDANSLANFFRGFGKGKSTEFLNRAKNYLVSGFMKSDDEWGKLIQEYKSWYPKIYKVAGKGRQVYFGRYLYLLFMVRVFIPIGLALVWGLTKMLLAIWWPWARDPEFETSENLPKQVAELVAYFGREIKRQINYSIVNVRGFGDNPDITDGFTDWTLTTLSTLIPVDPKFINLFDVANDIQAGEYQRRLEEQLNQLENQMRQQGLSDEEINLIRQRGEEMLRQDGLDTQLNIDSLEQEIPAELRRDEVGPVVGGNGSEQQSPIVTGLESEMKTAFDTWASSNGGRSPQWVSFSNNIGKVKVDGLDKNVQRLSSGKIVIMGTNPIIVLKN